MKFYSKRELCSLPNYKTLHEGGEGRQRTMARQTFLLAIAAISARDLARHANGYGGVHQKSLPTLKMCNWSCFAERLACKLSLFWYRLGGPPAGGFRPYLILCNVRNCSRKISR